MTVGTPANSAPPVCAICGLFFGAGHTRYLRAELLVYWEFMFADYLILLVESVHNYKMILPYLRGELTFENPVMKVVVGLCLLSCALQYIQQPIEALADPRLMGQCDYPDEDGNLFSMYSLSLFFGFASVWVLQLVAGLLSIMLYRLHSNAVDYDSGFWAHFDGILAILACTGSVGLGSKFAILDTLASTILHITEGHGEFGISLLGDFHCPDFLWAFIPSFCMAKWAITVVFFANIAVAMVPKLLHSGYFPLVTMACGGLMLMLSISVYWDLDTHGITGSFQKACTVGDNLNTTAWDYDDEQLLYFTLIELGSGGTSSATWKSETATFLWQSFSQTLSDVVAYVYIIITLRRLESALEAKSTGNEAQYLKSMKKFMRPVATLWVTWYFPVRLVALWTQVFMKRDPTFLPWLHHMLDCLFCFMLWLVQSCSRGWIIYQVCYRKRGGNVDVLYHEFSKMFTAGLLAQAADETAKGEDNVVVKGKAKCKAVLLSDLTLEWFRPSGNSSAEFAGADGNVNTAATVAFACENPDFFVSHSWHDDPTSKWEGLQEIADRFKRDNGREPTFWIDKFCIDQERIQESLKYLPVFVMSSNKMLVLVGPSYFSRLWCVWELFVRSVADPDCRDIVVWSIANLSQSAVSSMFDMFDLEKVQCFKQEDKEQIMAIIEQFKTGRKAFVNKIHSMKKGLLMEPDDRASGNSDSTSGAESVDAEIGAGGEPHTLSQSDAEKSQANPLSSDASK